jgi:hypothetical protein
MHDTAIVDRWHYFGSETKKTPGAQEGQEIPSCSRKISLMTSKRGNVTILGQLEELDRNVPTHWAATKLLISSGPSPPSS